MNIDAEIQARRAEAMRSAVASVTKLKKLVGLLETQLRQEHGETAFVFPVWLSDISEEVLALTLLAVKHNTLTEMAIERVGARRRGKRK